MRLWPSGLRLRAAAQPTPKPYRERGATGTVNLSGFLDQASEYLNALKNPRAFDIYDRMVRSDAAVREAMQHIKAPIRNATWTVEAASDEPEDLEIAAFVEKAYFEWLSQPFSVHLEQALRFLDYGFQVFELDWQIIDAELELDDGDGGTKALPSRQFLTFRHFGQRLPRTIYKWHAEAGELLGITQNVWVDEEQGYQFIPIDADQLLVFTHEREGDEFSGTSLLRAAYKPWLMKETVEKIMVVAIERHGVGTPVAYPSSAGKNDDAYMDRLEDILANHRSGEFNYIVAPDPRKTGTEDGCEFDLLGGSGTIPDFTGPLEYLRGEIKGNVLARFSELGHGSVGARATGDVQSEVWKDALHAVARQIEEVHETAVKRLVDANYPGVYCYPKLKAQDIESRSLAEFAQAVSQLVSAGAINADASFRAFAREGIGAPDEDDPTEPDPGNPNQPDPNAVESETQPNDPQPQAEPPPAEQPQAN